MNENEGFLTDKCRYRFQADGRLRRSMETGTVVMFASHVGICSSFVAVMLMETFDRLTRKEKFVWDVSQQLTLRLAACTDPPFDRYTAT